MTVPEGDRPRIVLAIDTATAPASVALRIGDSTRERGIEWRASFRELAPAIEDLRRAAGLDWVDVDGIALPAGPGSFTGLRIGAALALALCRATARPLYAVPTLAAVAEAFAPPGVAKVCATLDARRGRLYAAYCERAGPAGWNVVEGPFDADPREVEALAREVPRVGPDWTRVSQSGLAVTIARLATADPIRYELPSPQALELVYARSGIDPR